MNAPAPMLLLDQSHFGDCREHMRRMIAAGLRVNCIVTSPPYWNLRHYKSEPLVWKARRRRLCKGEAHFATFPRELAARCILAGTSQHGCCPDCGAGYVRIMKRGEPDLAHQIACGGDLAGEYHGKARKEYDGTGAENASTLKARILRGMVKKETVGWRPDCECHGKLIRSVDYIELIEPDPEDPNYEGEARDVIHYKTTFHPQGDVPAPVPAVVYDPFMGSGTTGAEACRLGRRWTGSDVQPEYRELQDARLMEHGQPGLPL